MPHSYKYTLREFQTCSVARVEANLLYPHKEDSFNRPVVQTAASIGTLAKVVGLSVTVKDLHCVVHRALESSSFTVPMSQGPSK